MCGGTTMNMVHLRLFPSPVTVNDHRHGVDCTERLRVISQASCDPIPPVWMLRMKNRTVNEEQSLRSIITIDIWQ